MGFRQPREVRDFRPCLWPATTQTIKLSIRPVCREGCRRCDADITTLKYRGAAIGALAATGFAGLQWLGRTAGATRGEQAAHLPGDELIEHPMMVTTHAITINTPPERIWPWLVQMGWHRGQWYTARWVDRLSSLPTLPAPIALCPTCSSSR